MRLRTFTAPTIAQALRQVRAELGEDAIILSTESGRGGARLVAAMEVAETGGAADAPSAVFEPADEAPAPPQTERDSVRAALLWHGVPTPLAERLLRTVAPQAPDAGAALAAALDATLTFQPLASGPCGRPVMLVGPPGAGKTLTAAKLIVEAHRLGRPAMAASSDTRRAGGFEQLEAFTRILGLPLARIEEDADLARIATAAARGAIAVIDSAGCCPFGSEEMQALKDQIEAANAEPVLVLPAGTDAAEAAEVASAFAHLGCRRLIATRIDVSRRLGALIAAAAGGRLAFAAASISPHAAEPPAAVNANALARLILSMAPATASAAVSAPAPGPRKVRR
jgi:flagellar biosynthesis protein FlhF